MRERGRASGPSWRRSVYNWLRYVLLCAIAVVFLAPIWWMFKTAVTPASEVLLSPVRVFPKPIDFSVFFEIWDTLPLLAFFRNSTVVSTLTTIGTVVSCSLTAFALTQFRFPGRSLLLVVILGTIMVPIHATIIPQFLFFSKIKWLDTLRPLWVPSFFGGFMGAFSIFLLRQALLGVPSDLFDAATVDGANPWQLYRLVALPLIRPQLAVVAVFTFMSSWNDFLAPIVFISSTDKMTVTGGLSFFRTSWHVYWNEVMAGALLAMLPTLVLYMFAQRQLVQANLQAGLKG